MTQSLLPSLDTTEDTEVEQLRKEVNELRAAIVIVVNHLGVNVFSKDQADRLVQILTKRGTPGIRVKR